jgi:hypothetical protein
VTKLHFKDTEILGIVLVSTFVGWYLDDWIGGAAIAVLWLGARLLITGDGIPVLFLAFLYQWAQVTLGVFYQGIFGRVVPTIYLSDYRPMVLIGLGCVLSIAVGVRLGVDFIRRKMPIGDELRPNDFLPWPILLTAYAIGVVIEGTLVQFAGDFPSLRQVFFTLVVVRMGLLFLIMRRLTNPVFRVIPFTLLLSMEVVLGFTGFFAGFREPLALSGMALLEIFNFRKAAHLATMAVLVAVMGTAAVMWMGVRDDFRKDFSKVEDFNTSQGARMDRISSLAQGFFGGESSTMLQSLDNLVDRMWVVYYPALAVTRVPAVLDHTNGSIAEAAVIHIFTPRVLFPNKPNLPSDSEMVRKYSGVYVAGAETGTSIAFGYAAEMYIDFGLPLMFIPVLIFGLFSGAVYGWLERAIRHRELAVSVVTVVFWLSLYLFERSTANVLGFELSYIVYVGIPALFLDRFLLIKEQAARQTGRLYAVPDVPDTIGVADH